ncbi:MULTISPECIES: RsmE family RNA methyltransferase [Chryseobacterium]|uniref:Ribosomal RNA small subunit methyltransferase E n=1 Tax=Chryseobacterium camelliae TaxID=1265445 RepID=A0ABU0TJU9_9FLAO|nr:MULTISPECIES: RsmE family RNA methyltransferase [Chryseobacterium]MDT3408828.1 16S rRNA (uracil1498-N3)-methyltransferase [Pseudacidovorax intermedius]MDQ1097314.1 16S rRNA (uracil1498-N3)-methyltransferase [Chryseobacterium camelliae]MDQ1101248.1 16S rRNA (uracil1498-N3)-methyltransferase [Chryseobacterium sp. SORGH_AS_1048]MDR6084693.1 16S rRNA (uracil1498-N3)-methyltransferase [Chryseobacterium sp. SORGH_AS_0909]MDR6132966.1 16S rRNA (uracil1498-N3)-methyltransferase [Chryseobacterium sp
MKLFYGEINGNQALINEEEQQHIVKVLRMKDGEEIHITDGKGNLASGRLLIEGKKASLEVDQLSTDLPGFSPRLHIAIAPTKNIDRIEFFVEKSVEMGISEITLLQTEKTERKNVNIDKLRKQAVAASKQSLRFHFPVINDLTKIQDFLKHTHPETTFVAHCHENLERQELKAIPVMESITFLIGPEGDFSEKEIAFLSQHNIRAVSLGNQRLRTETAGVFIAAWNYFRGI